MIEVETHYLLPDWLLSKLINEMDFISESYYEDTYYDNHRCLRDDGMFLRRRERKFELKIQLNSNKNAFVELDNDDEILEALSFSRKSSLLDLDDCLDWYGIGPVGIICTQRKSYRLDGILFVVDKIDCFHRKIVEMERVVTFPSEVDSSLSLIRYVAKKYGFAEYEYADWHKADFILSISRSFFNVPTVGRV